MKRRRSLTLAALLVLLAATTAIGQEAEDTPATESPPQAPATIEAGDALVAEGDLTGAAEVFRAVTDAEPKNAQAWFKLGSALLGAEQHASAAEAFEKAYRYEYTPKELLAFMAARAYAADGATGKANDF